MCCIAGFVLVPAQFAGAATQAEAIVAAARAMEGHGYPYCFDGGNTAGPTVGITDPASDGSYSNCASIGKVGFDCTGLTLYAVYQGTGNAGLSHDGHQARSGGGQAIGSVAALQPGDVVYFDYDASNGLNAIDHAGIYAGGGQVLSAVSEKWGIRTESIGWYEAGGLQFVGGVRYWSAGGGPPGNGSFVSYQGNTFRIAGGAPLYVSNWSVFGGPQPTQELTASQWEGLRSRPADGTIIRSNGTVYIVAGGAPLVVSSCAAIGSCAGYVDVDPYDISHLDHLNAVPNNGTLLRAGSTVYTVAGGAPLVVTGCGAIGSCNGYVQIDPYAISHLDHLNAVPTNGTLLRAAGAVYVIAGGAPLAVGSCGAIGSCNGYVQVDPYAIGHLDHLNAVPSDGTLIRATNGGTVWVVAGGAPLEASSCAAIGSCSGYVNIDPYAVGHLDHLNALPADGTFIRTSSGGVYRVAGGAPFAVGSWNPFGGAQPYVAIDQWDIANLGNPAINLSARPADGTLVEGLPSDTYWSFEGGLRTQVPANPAATGVDDVGLAAFAIRSAPTVGASGPASTAIAGRPTASVDAPAGRSGGRQSRTKGRLACRKIKNRRKRARCVSADRRRRHRRAHGRARRTRGSRAASDRPVVGGSRLLNPKTNG
jgi:cell wall-associated NlpC family hydrolase